MHTGQERAINKPPKLTKGETWMLKLTVALLLAVGAIGLLVSFQSVSAKAALWGFETPEMLPAAIDLAIPGFTIAHLLLIRMDMELAWVRAVPWTLTAVTVYLNIQAGTNTAAKIGHGALPLVWVVCSEIAGHVYRALIGEATGRRMERVRRSRMVMSPFRTLALWRRMILWEETSYLTAVQRERDRLLARAGLRETYGWAWRIRAPRRDRVLLRMGDLNPAETFPRETAETETVETETSIYETGETETAQTAETSETETARRSETSLTTASPRDLTPGEAETETPGLALPETTETTTPETPRETETKSAKVSQSHPAETETRKVSPIGDRNPETEINHLLGLMRDRESADAVGLAEAMTETGRPKATAAKRLKAARDLYRAEAA